MRSADLYEETLRFAARAHGAQKTPHDLPYVVHLATVAAEVEQALRRTPGRDEDLAVACALLHDVLEDTETTALAVAERFGARVLAGVQALTKDARLPKDRQLADSLDRILAQPPEVGIVKLADRVANLGPPPPTWGPEKITSYREEARLILARLGPRDATLAERLALRIARYP